MAKDARNASGSTQQPGEVGAGRGTSDPSMMPGKIPSDKAMGQQRGGGQTSEADNVRHGDVAGTVDQNDVFDGPQNPNNQPSPTPGSEARQTRAKR